MRRPTIIESVLGAACVTLTILTLGNFDLTSLSWLKAAGGALFMFMPIGCLLASPLRADLLRCERIVLALLVGYPASALVIYAAERCGAGTLAVPLLTMPLLAVIIRSMRSRRAADETAFASKDAPFTNDRRKPHVLLLALVPLILFTTTRGAATFRQSHDGLAYDHCVDDSFQIAVYWELYRGVPPKELPFAAGLPFPQYHLLSFMPGLLLMRQLGMDAADVYHGVSLLWRIAFLMGGIYLVARIRGGNGRIAAAALPAVFIVMQAAQAALDQRFSAATTPFFFLRTSESGGGAIAVWSGIAALLALSERSRGFERRYALILASALAGVSFGFKAHLFLLLGTAYVLALGVAFWRDRSKIHLLALAVLMLTTAVVFLSWRAPGDYGFPRFTPGMFARLYVYPVLAEDPWPVVRATLLGPLRALPSGLADVLASLLAAWRMITFSFLIPSWIICGAKRWRTLPLIDAAFMLACLLSIPLAYGFSITSIGGIVSPYDFILIAQCLPFFAAVADVLIVAALLKRRTAKSDQFMLNGIVALSMLLSARLISGKPWPTPFRNAVLSPDEQCALLYLRNATPLDAVVAIARGDGAPPGSRRINHHAIVAGFTGRRSVHEFYWKEADPSIDRVRAMRRLFSTESLSEAEELIERFGVDFMVEYAGRPIRFPKTRLQEVFTRKTVRVYWVPRRNARLRDETLPRSLPASAGLECHDRRGRGSKE
ncbi:MAG: hypothetical protein JXO72_07485 [Vicinamibacteria bacterium]|nr:hypothetical protein [Vicinamibacteria bacterium]